MNNHVEMVDRRVSHDLLMQLTEIALIVVQCVLPASIVLTRSTLASRDILANIIGLYRGNFFPDRHAKVLVGDLAIFVVIEPVK